MSQRDNIREARRAIGVARRSGSMSPLRVGDSVGTGSAETYRLIRGLVKEPSGVTAGATLTIDNIEPLAGGLDPSGGTASFELEVDEAKQNYSDNAEVIAIYDPAAANSWVDITDVEGGSGVVYVKFGADTGTGSSDTNATLQESSTCSLSDSTNPITVCNKTGRMIWADAYAQAFQAADGTYHAISSDSVFEATGTAASASNAGNSYAAFNLSSPNAVYGTVLPAGTISVTNPLQLTIESSDKIIAKHDAGSGVWIAVAAQSSNPGVLIAKVSGSVTARSGDTFGSSSSVPLGNLVAGVWTAHPDYTAVTIYNPSQRIINYSASFGPNYLSVALQNGHWMLLGPMQLETVSGYDTSAPKTLAVDGDSIAWTTPHVVDIRAFNAGGNTLEYQTFDGDWTEWHEASECGDEA